MQSALTAAEHTTARPEVVYTCFIDLYGLYDRVKRIADIYLRGQPYYVSSAPISRNGLRVHRIYLVNRRQYVLIASMYFDAWNSCRFCNTFKVLFYQHFVGTVVYCRNCGIQRLYRADNPRGYDLANQDLPSSYPQLLPGPAVPLPTLPATPLPRHK